MINRPDVWTLGVCLLARYVSLHYAGHQPHVLLPRLAEALLRLLPRVPPAYFARDLANFTDKPLVCLPQHTVRVYIYFATRGRHHRPKAFQSQTEAQVLCSLHRCVYLGAAVPPLFPLYHTGMYIKELVNYCKSLFTLYQYLMAN